jgi:hypothetical protein
MTPDTDLPKVDDRRQASYLHRRHVPLLIAVTICAAMSIGVTGIYTGAQLGERRSDALLAQQRLDYERRLVADDQKHTDELARVTAETASLSAALASLDHKVDEHAVVVEKTQATAESALAIAHNTADHPDVTRQEYNALAAKTQAAATIANRSVTEHHDVSRDEYNALSARVNTTAAQTQTIENKVKKIEEPPPAKGWWGSGK